MASSAPKAGLIRECGRPESPSARTREFFLSTSSFCFSAFLWLLRRLEFLTGVWEGDRVAARLTEIVRNCRLKNCGFQMREGGPAPVLSKLNERGTKESFEFLVLS